MKSIYNIQTKCQELNDCIRTNYPDFKQDYCTMTTFNGFDLFYATKCTYLVGYTGLISFTNLSNTRAFMPMYLYQVQENEVEVVIAMFEQNTTFYNNEYFPGGSVPKSGKPSKCYVYTYSIFHSFVAIRVDDPNLSYGFIEGFFTINMILMIITVSLLVYIIYKRKHRLIRSGGFSSSVLILLGLLCIEIAEIFMCISITSAICKLMDVFILVGVSFIISTLVAKLYRIYRIFQNSSAVAVQISDKDLGIFTFLICCGSMILFILYNFLGGGLQAITKTAELDPLYMFSICEVPTEAFQTIFLISFYVYFVSIFLIAAILAFFTRKTLREFNESSNVGFVVYCWLGIAIIYAPIYYLQGNSTNSNQIRYIIRFIAIDLAIALTLGILFWGKISKVIRSERHAAKRTNRDSHAERISRIDEN